MACCSENNWDLWIQNREDQQDEVTALVSIFEGTDRFRVLFSPDDSNGQYTLQVDVPVCLEEKGTVIKAWIPFNDEMPLPELNVEDVPGNLRPQFQRTESGCRWHSSFHVNYLPPLCLQVVFPLNYPSESPPIFTLSSQWQDGLKLSSLCKQLDTLWSENEGSPILYTWIDWLDNNIVSHLGLESGVVLVQQQEGIEDAFSSQDDRALPECDNLQEDLVNLLRFDVQQEWQTFRNNLQTCGICFEEKPGIQFYRIPDCCHHFCAECLKAYCDFHVGEGTVQQLHCPDSKCKQSLTPQILQALLGEEEYIRWEKLLLQRALDSMGDVVWCPRCNFVVIREEEETLQLAHCTNCWYSFCTDCRDAWHQGSKCKTVEERINELERESIENEDSMSEAELKRRTRIQKKLEYMSCMTIKKTAKPCPTCRAPIEKNMGCNKIMCTMCHSSMCWACGKAIRDYDHFEKCTLFPTQDLFRPPGPRWERPVNLEAERVREAMLDPEAVSRIFPCPRCRQRNLRDGRNNHVRCWACRANGCFACHSVINGVVSAHYRADMPCKQHSD